MYVVFLPLQKNSPLTIDYVINEYLKLRGNCNKLLYKKYPLKPGDRTVSDILNMMRQIVTLSCVLAK